MSLHTVPKYLSEQFKAYKVRRNHHDVVPSVLEEVIHDFDNWAQHYDVVHSVLEDLEYAFENSNDRDIPMKYVTQQYAIHMVQNLLETGVMPTKLAYRIMIDLFSAQSLSDVAEPLMQTLIKVEAKTLNTSADLQDFYCFKAIMAYPSSNMGVLLPETFSRWLIMLLDNASNPCMIMEETGCFRDRNSTYLFPLQKLDMDRLLSKDLTIAMVVKALGTDETLLARRTRLTQGDEADGALPLLKELPIAVSDELSDLISEMVIIDSQDEVVLLQDLCQHVQLAFESYGSRISNERRNIIIQIANMIIFFPGWHSFDIDNQGKHQLFENLDLLVSNMSRCYVRLELASFFAYVDIETPTQLTP
ncbi:hypothetical protein B0A52_04206 [Exophiala mesophila]|uniref:Uncharacterized protein n=1 Tax=Exophiala mesophila TaxID=212818 RepID=A0A438N818_EXOME|nr:hypothetical protein B0A52_04206 [Exophiala mesophila]